MSKAEDQQPGRVWAKWEWLSLLAPVLAVAAALTLSYLWNEDFWWYLTSGRYLLEHRQFPSEDPFLYTVAAGSGWVYHSWLWTVLVAVVDLLAGLDGVVVFHALLAVVLCAVIYTTGRVDRWGLANALAVTLFLVAIGPRLCGKAEVATWLMLAVFYRVLDSGKPFTWRRGAALGALQILWAHLHGGYPLGIFIALCYSLGGWIESRREGKKAAPSPPARFPPLWFPAVLLLLAVADPWLFRERLAPFALVTGSRSLQPAGDSGGPLILEWRSPFAAAATAADPTLPWLYLAAAGVGFASFVAVRRRSVPRLLFLSGMAVLGATAIRHLPGLALSAALILVSHLAGRRTSQPVPQPRKRQRGKAGERKTRGKWRYAAACGLLAVTLLAVAAALRVARQGFEAGQSPGFFTHRPGIVCPQAAGFILDNRLPGPIFNDFQMGAYLSSRLVPRYRLFIDNRVLDSSAVVRYTELVSSPARFQEAERRHGFRTVILGNYSKTVRSALGMALARDPRWRLVYLDPLAVIFVKDRPDLQPVIRPRRTEPGAPQVPFGEPGGSLLPLAAVQRVFLHDFPSNYLIEYLAVLGQLGQPEEVVELATLALETMPREPRLYRQRCAAHFVRGALPAAVADCGTAYRQRPEDHQLVALYAMVLKSAGRRPEALALLGEALRQDPNDATLARLRSSL